MTKDGRIIDPDKKNITTSEGQTYIMLQSLIFNNEETFKLAYSWAKTNLQRKDKLFSWLWGKDSNGQYKILDENSASDADVDIAFALLLANKKWGDEKYLLEAEEIIDAIWSYETRRIDHHLVLMPGALQNKAEKIEINPSYFSPYAFRVFQKYDDSHDWQSVVDSSYYYLNSVILETKTNLPPDWFLIKDGKIVLEDSQRSDFSYDAIRVFARIYYDFLMSGDKRALSILDKSDFFIEKWKNSYKIYTNYKKDGAIMDNFQHTGSISILLPVINIYNEEIANEIYQNKLMPKFNDTNYWSTMHDYYGKNLSLFGWFLYDKNTPEYKNMFRNKIIKK
jgi:endoglucanase